VDNLSDDYTSQLWVFDALDALYEMEMFPDDDFALAHEMLSRMHVGVEDVWMRPVLGDITQGTINTAEEDEYMMEEYDDMIFPMDLED